MIIIIFNIFNAFKKSLYRTIHTLMDLKLFSESKPILLNFNVELYVSIMSNEQLRPTEYVL